MRGITETSGYIEELNDLFADVVVQRQYRLAPSVWSGAATLATDQKRFEAVKKPDPADFDAVIDVMKNIAEALGTKKKK